MKLLTDEQLIGEVQEGNISAFAQVVTRYQRKLHAFALRYTRDQDLAQDIVQESFISVYKTIERIDTGRKFSSYLFTVARNQAISMLRTQKHHVPLDAAAAIPSREKPDVQMEQKEEGKRVKSALNKIDAKYKNVVTLYYFDDLSYEEVGKRLSIPVNTVRTHLKRAKEALKKILETL